MSTMRGSKHKEAVIFKNQFLAGKPALTCALTWHAFLQDFAIQLKLLRPDSIYKNIDTNR